MSYDFNDPKWAHCDKHVTANQAINRVVYIGAAAVLVPGFVWLWLVNGPLVGLAFWVKIGAFMLWGSSGLCAVLVLSACALVREGRHYRQHGLKPGAWRQ